MQFGLVADPGSVDFVLPPDAPQTTTLLEANRNDHVMEVYIGCAKWNKADLKGFYPKGTKDELTYYATQFNSIELNATFYKLPDPQQVISWKDKTPDGFKFFPKITNTVTHFKRLIGVQDVIKEFCRSVGHFDEKLGMVFLQLHDNFKPKDIERLKIVLNEFPIDTPLAVEVRNGEWFSDPEINEAYSNLLQSYNVANIIVDTAGRRDLLHMRLTSPVAFVRWVGANHESDITRLDDWAVRIAKWRRQGLQKLYFFVHQNVELESPMLASHFMTRLNNELVKNL